MYYIYIYNIICKKNLFKYLSLAFLPTQCFIEKFQSIHD